MKLINYAEKYPQLNSREIAMLQSTICLCGEHKKIGLRLCKNCLDKEIELLKFK